MSYQATIFAITDSKLYVPVVTLSTQDDAKLLQQIKSGFKRTVNWNKYQWKVTFQALNPYSDFLIDPSFQRVICNLFYCLKIRMIESTYNILSSNCRNEGL